MRLVNQSQDKNHEDTVMYCLLDALYSEHMYPIKPWLNMPKYIKWLGVRRPDNGDTNKISYYDHVRQTRYRLKTGKFVRKHFAAQIAENLDTAICHCTESINSKLYPTPIDITILSGKDIETSYWDGRACEAESSCMTGAYTGHRESARGIVRLYGNNPDIVSLVIATQSGKYARALLWQTNKGEFCDRIYGHDTDTRYALETWAKKNCDITRTLQGLYVNGLDDRVDIDNMHVSMKRPDNGLYPYCDTFHWGAYTASKIQLYTSEKGADFILNCVNGSVSDMNSRVCYGCDCDYQEDELICADGDYFCEDCFSDRFFTCEHCDEISRNDEYGQNGICQSCLDYNYTECAECNEYTHNDDVTDTSNGDVCRSCIGDNYTECVECNEYTHNDDVTDTSNGDVCRSCIGDNYTECVECNEYTHNDDVTDTSNGDVCEVCFSDRYRFCDVCSDTVPLDDCVFGAETLCHECYDASGSIEIVVLRNGVVI